MAENSHPFSMTIVGRIFFPAFIISTASRKVYSRGGGCSISQRASRCPALMAQLVLSGSRLSRSR
jgi:hypothetical protein